MYLEELDATVINALKQNRKIEAIKLLREKENIDLKEAKHAVEEYLSNHPGLVPQHKRSTNRSCDGLLFLVAIACFLYLGYEYFIKA